MIIITVFIQLYLLCSYTHAEIFITDNSFVLKEKRTGSLDKPFSTIKECVKALKNAGDECQIRAGTYHEEISITGLHGTINNPVIIRGYKDERPILDGTVEIKPIGKWKQYKDEIYRAKINHTIWQLFVDDLMMTNARWPNAKWSDKSVFNGTLWPGLSETSKRGLIVNKGSSLRNTNIDMTGAMAILNIGSFNTFVAEVKKHQAGSNQFVFDDTFGEYHFKPKRSRYFLEDKLELLDAREEWFFNKTDHMLYMITPSGQTPQNMKIRGKVQSYALQITDSSNLIIKGLDFFATTLKAETFDTNNRVDRITFHSLNFKHHSYSKRMLRDASLIDWTIVNGIYTKNIKKRDTWGIFTFFNNTFYGSDGLALSYSGRNVTLENNLFEYNDFTAANMVKGGGGLGTIKSDSIYDHFLRNTLRYNGASVGIRPGLIPHVELNDVTKQCWGIIQNDGTGVQLQRKQQTGALLERNWIHDQPKYGLRFDGEPPKIGQHGTMFENVVCRCNGLMVKGDYHKAINNLAFQKENGKDDDKQGAGCMLCVLKYVRTNPGEINQHSTVSNNIADVANGGVKPGTKTVFPLAGSTIDNNSFDIKPQNVLMDPDHFDFRVKPGSEPARKRNGPYPYQKNMKKYWIPGRKLYKTSTPVPPNGSDKVKASNRDILMWLNAYNVDTHNVYFGTDKKNLKDIGRILNGNNVVYLPTKVKRGEQYYWRVDAITKDENGKEIIYQGDVWSFKTAI